MIAIDAWQPADGLTLEPNALLAAKEQKRCLALTAGPGAGKTEMLAQRADFLLRTGTCRYTKQKIMGWAGALDGIFQTFAADFAATPLNMYRNFRSKPRLLRLQNEIIRVLDPASVMPEEQIAGDEGEVLAWCFEDSRQEAEHLHRLESGDTKKWFGQVVETEIGPLLEEYWFDAPDEARKATMQLMQGW